MNKKRIWKEIAFVLNAYKYYILVFLVFAAYFLSFIPESVKQRAIVAVKGEASPPKAYKDKSGNTQVAPVPYAHQNFGTFAPPLRGSGLRAFALQMTSRGAKFPLAVVWTDQCGLANSALIKKDLKTNPRDNLFLSIEPADPNDKSFVPIRRTVPIEHLSQDFLTTFYIPYTRKTKHLGVFLCSDPKPIGRCATKLLFDPKRIIDTPPGFPGKLYSFHYLILSGTSVLIPSYPMKSQNLQLLSKYVLDLPDGDIDEKKRILLRVKLLQHALRPLSMDISGAIAKVPLPDGKNERCELSSGAPLHLSENLPTNRR